MRVRTNIIIEESLLAKIDQIAGDKLKRASVIETALREFIERNESKTLSEIDEKAEVSATK